jgi:hypothetical protein
VRALRRDPNERFGSAKELAEALDQAANGASMAPSSMRSYHDSAVFAPPQLAPPPSGPSSVSGSLAHTPALLGSSPGMQGPTLVGTSTTAARTTTSKPAVIIGAVASVLVLGAVGALAIVSTAGKQTQQTQAPAAAHAPVAPTPPAPAPTPTPTPIVTPVAAAPTSSAAVASDKPPAAAPAPSTKATQKAANGGAPQQQPTTKSAPSTKKADTIGF